MAESTTPLLSVALIVRDEVATLGSCLESVRGWADEIVVVDTGSTDGTQSIARAAGARLRSIAWVDDFASARNAALSACTGKWVLSLDADEIISGSAPGALRRLVRCSDDLDALSVLIKERSGPDRRGLAGHRELKLFRSDRVRWAGRVHERLVRTEPDGTVPRFEELSDDLLTLIHSGYSSPDAIRRKSARNARLGAIELAEVLADPRRHDDAARVRVDLGRSLLGTGDRAAALEHFQFVVDHDAGTPSALMAMDFLTRAALGDGRLEQAERWLDRLRRTGAPEGHCDFLLAQLLAERGSFEASLAVVDRITDLRDAGGHPLDRRVLDQLRGMIDRARA